MDFEEYISIGFVKRAYQALIITINRFAVYVVFLHLKKYTYNCLKPPNPGNFLPASLVFQKLLILRALFIKLVQATQIEANKTSTKDLLQ